MVRTGLFRRGFICASAMLLLLIGSTAVFACACDEICHPGEVYSDTAEMCVAEEKATS